MLLKLDLLPGHYAVARRNKRVIILAVPLVVATVAVWLFMLLNVKAAIARTSADLAQATEEANAVRALETEIQAKQAELAPIQAKVDFVSNADKSGEAYWDRFHKINEYIYERAVVTSFSISPPSSVTFSVELTSTEEAGRFILNLVRCPYVTGISISGTPGESGAIEGVSGVSAGGGGGMGPGMGGGMGPGMGGGMGPGMGGGMGPGMAGGPPGGMPGGPGMGPGASPGGGGGGTTAGSGRIAFTVSCSLVEPIAVPTPPSGAAAPAAGGDMGGGMGGGMPGGGMGGGMGGPPGGGMGGGMGGPPGGGMGGGMGGPPGGGMGGGMGGPPGGDGGAAGGGDEDV